MTQAKLNTILEKHRKWLNDEEGGECADLRGADLRHADLQDADLQCADLRGADLRHADLQDADLQRAVLPGANLQGANLHGANLQCADLQGANLHGANLRRANLQGANLHGAELQDANIDYSCLPIWCGGLKMRICDRIAIQLLYHVLSLIAYSDHVSPYIKKLLLTKDIVKLANKFHKVNECGRLEVYKEDAA